MKELSLYEQLKLQNIIDMVRPMLDRQLYSIRLIDGKIVAKEGQVARDTPWIHTGSGYGYDCAFWHTITFDLILKGLSVPRKCHNCWKVVVRPRTLEQLFTLLDIQTKLKLHSKCGIETRKTVNGLYGGYFYNKGPDAGMRCYKTVYQALAENKIMSTLLDEVDSKNKTVRLLLKRGCTEFEHKVGRSDEWEIKPEQHALEDLVDAFLILEKIDLLIIS